MYVRLFYNIVMVNQELFQAALPYKIRAPIIAISLGLYLFNNLAVSVAYPSVYVRLLNDTVMGNQGLFLAVLPYKIRDQQQ